jgi:hypothetical protein
MIEPQLSEIREASRARTAGTSCPEQIIGIKASTAGLGFALIVSTQRLFAVRGAPIARFDLPWPKKARQAGSFSEKNDRHVRSCQTT